MLEAITSDALPVRHGFFTRKGGASSGIFAGLNCGPGSSDLSEVVGRHKDIQYSSRTRTITTYMASMQKQRRLLGELMKLVPEDARKDNPWYQHAAKEACDRLFNVFHLIYQSNQYEGNYKDFQFGARTMRDHWQSGLADIRHSLHHRDWLDMPTAEEPFITHDVHRQ